MHPPIETQDSRLSRSTRPTVETQRSVGSNPIPSRHSESIFGGLCDTNPTRLFVVLFYFFLFFFTDFDGARTHTHTPAYTHWRNCLY